MAELYSIICDKVVEILEGKIRATISGYVKNDVLHVMILKGDHEWECAIDGIPELAALGCPSTRIADKIEHEYKKEVMKRYFF